MFKKDKKDKKDKFKKNKEYNIKEDPNIGYFLIFIVLYLWYAVIESSAREEKVRNYIYKMNHPSSKLMKEVDNKIKKMVKEANASIEMADIVKELKMDNTTILKAPNWDKWGNIKVN